MNSLHPWSDDEQFPSPYRQRLWRSHLRAEDTGEAYYNVSICISSSRGHTTVLHTSPPACLGLAKLAASECMCFTTALCREHGLPLCALRRKTTAEQGEIQPTMAFPREAFPVLAPVLSSIIKWSTNRSISSVRNFEPIQGSMNHKHELVTRMHGASRLQHELCRIKSGYPAEDADYRYGAKCGIISVSRSTKIENSPRARIYCSVMVIRDYAWATISGLLASLQRISTENARRRTS